jgi:hypothetical protein
MFKIAKHEITPLANTHGPSWSGQPSSVGAIAALIAKQVKIRDRKKPANPNFLAFYSSKCFLIPVYKAMANTQ